MQGRRRYHRVLIALVTATAAVAFLLYVGFEVVGARRAAVSSSTPNQGPREELPPVRRASAAAPTGPQASVLPARPTASELAPAYRGDVVVEGTVVGADPDNLNDVRVRCAPALFDPYTPEELAYVSVAVDPNGRFVLKGMPRAPSYDLVAGSKDYYGATVVTRDGVVHVSAEIRVHKLLFERVLCVDEAGEKVDKSLLQIRPRNPQRLFLHVTTGVGDAEVTRMLSRFGVDVTVGDGEAACFWYAGKGGGGAFEVSVEVPGFESLDVTLEGKPLSRWPDARTVRLHRMPLPSDLAVYRVAWPTLSWPEDWGSSAERQPFCVFVRNLRSGFTTIVTEGRRAFVAGRDVTWEIRPIEMASSERSLPYVAREVDGEILLEPDYPKYGFVTLRYEPGTGDADSYAALFVDAGTFPPPRIVWPGCARIGPLSAGPHKIVRQLRSQSGEIVRVGVLDIDVQEGLSEIKW